MAKRTVCPRITIHTDYYYRSFLTKTNTTGYFFSVLITLLCIFLPFTSVYSTGCKFARLIKNFPPSHSYDALCQTSGPRRLQRMSTQKFSSRINFTRSSYSRIPLTTTCSAMSTAQCRASSSKHRTRWRLPRLSTLASIVTKMVLSTNGTSR